MKERKIKKTVYTLNINGFSPEVTAITYPLMRHYADKIRADFYEINTRVFPERYSPTYEKFQIRKLAVERGDEWAIFFDADAMIHPEMFDITAHLPKDTVAHNAKDMLGIRWTYDHIFLRDGRHIAGGNWCTIASDWCFDIWNPLDEQNDITYDEAVSRIRPTVNERLAGVTPDHLIDDYTTSRNIAKYGLKFITVNDICQRIGAAAMVTVKNPDGSETMNAIPFFHHEYTFKGQSKVDRMRGALKLWKLDKPSIKAVA